MIILKTNFGDIKLKLDYEATPVTVGNFLQYAREGFYEDTIFHRVIDSFMIQGGGFDKEMQQKETREPISNEADKGKSNKRGTVAMARTSDPHSASAQFFINVADNPFLDHRNKTTEGWGYCVFGEVVDGMDIVDKIKNVETRRYSGHSDVPVEKVMIDSVVVFEEA